MSKQTSCPTCGSKVQVSNGVTNHFIPIDTSKVVVAFAEWKDGEKFLYCYMGEGVYKYIHPKLGAFMPADLYQYWIKNVYNK